MAFGAILAISTAILGINGIWNVALTQIGFPFLAWLGLDAIGALAESGRVRSVLRVVAVCYIVWWAWWLVDSEWVKSGFAIHNGPMLSAVLSLGALILMGIRLRDMDRQPWRDPGLVAAMAILISYLPGVALEPVWAEAFGVDPEVSRRIAGWRLNMVSVGYLLFTAAFMVQPKDAQACGRE
ncbi:MAG TPA: hypothetical protein PLL69_10860 [Gemmatimonadales bacterium]|nr:hypothetical protein [Gemmatimonadales bacterium]